MKSGDIFQSKYLKKEDILRPTILTIDHVKGEMIDSDNGKEQKAVMLWRGSNLKPMIVNKGNWITLADAYGEESDGWSGHQVEVYVDPSIMFGGKRVGGLRIRIPSHTGPQDQPFAPVWTFEEALAAGNHAGLTREFIVNSLREKGMAGWNAARCTPMVQEMIRVATDTSTPGEQSFEKAEMKDSIPF